MPVFFDYISKARKNPPGYAKRTQFALRPFSLSKNLSLHGLKAPLCKGSCHGKAVTEGLLQ